MEDEDILFVACTRPPMKWGVAFNGFLLNAIVTFTVTVLIVQEPTGFLIGIAVHLALRELCRIDPHFFGKYSLWSQTKMFSTFSTSILIWGGSRLQPSPACIRLPTQIRSCL